MATQRFSRVFAFTLLAVAGAVAKTGAIGAQSERVPDAAIVNGVPQGMFVGRSLLSGKAVCLLFLSGGRITRAIPEGGLENFDWARHATAHGPDSGTWQMRGGQLVVTWGDGGVHQGPITVHPDGIEFYGKRYAKPVTVDIAALAGRWESSRGTAIAGGAGVNRVSQLLIAADGRYQWVGTTGGVVEGRAVANDRAMSGQIAIRGLTIIFTSDAGMKSTCTFLPAAGQPLTAFSVDTDLFTRSGPPQATRPSPPTASPATRPPASTPPVAAPAANSYRGMTFSLPSGWTSGMQQGRFVIAPPGRSAGGAVLVVLYGAERLSVSFDEWLRTRLAADLNGMTVVQSTPATRTKSGALDVLSSGRTVQDRQGNVVLEVYYAISDGQRAGLAMVATNTQAALAAATPSVQALFQSLRFGGDPAGAAPAPTMPTAAHSPVTERNLHAWGERYVRKGT